MRLGTNGRRYELFCSYNNLERFVKLVTKDNRVIASFDLPFCEINFIDFLAHYLS